MTVKKKGKVLFTVRLPSSEKVAYHLKAAIMLTVVLLIIFVFGEEREREYDNTDWPELELRSGLTLYIDHGTGCHWIKGGFFGFGSVMPRLNNRKEQVCLKEDFRPSETGTET